MATCLPESNKRIIMPIDIPVRRRCIVVSVEAPWPTVNGGRARTSEVIRQLAVDYDVTVVYPGRAAPEATLVTPPGVNLIAVDTASLQPRVTDRLGLLPRLGKLTLRAIESELRVAVQHAKPEFVYWSHSYLGAVGMNMFRDLLHVVEFANLERQRSLSLSRSSKRVLNKISAMAEYVKGIWWEPRCARRASLAISLNHREASTLKRYGANVVLVPNGLYQRDYLPSPSQSRQVLTLGSWAYEPNRTALESFLANEWTEILALEPDMKLVIAGSGSENLLNGEISSVRGVISLGFVEDLSNAFRDSFCFLAPATSGGGSQLKVAEALSHNRVVVGPSFLKREISPEMPRDIVIAAHDIARSMIDLSKAPDRRHSLEKDLAAFVAGRTWGENFSPVRNWLADAVRDARAKEESSIID